MKKLLPLAIGAALLAAASSAFAHECWRSPFLRRTIASTGPTSSASTSTTTAIAMNVPCPRLGTRVILEKTLSNAARSVSFAPLDLPEKRHAHEF